MDFNLGKFDVFIERKTFQRDNFGDHYTYLGTSIERHDEVTSVVDLERLIIEEQMNCPVEDIVEDISLNVFRIFNCCSSFSFLIGSSVCFEQQSKELIFIVLRRSSNEVI